MFAAKDRKALRIMLFARGGGGWPPPIPRFLAPSMLRAKKKSCHHHVCSTGSEGCVDHILFANLLVPSMLAVKDEHHIIMLFVVQQTPAN